MEHRASRSMLHFLLTSAKALLDQEDNIVSFFDGRAGMKSWANALDNLARDLIVFLLPFCTDC